MHFWILSNVGNRKHPRLQIDDSDDFDGASLGSMCRRGKIIAGRDWPSPPPLFSYNSVSVFEDVPWPLGLFFIVSDRVKKCLQSYTRGELQFLPVRLNGPRIHELKHTYWQVNCLKRLSCLHADSYNTDNIGKFVEVAIIDGSRIPANTHIFIAVDFETRILISDTLKQRLEREHFLGLAFDPVAHADGTNWVAFVKPDYTAKPSSLNESVGREAAASKPTARPKPRKTSRKRRGRSS